MPRKHGAAKPPVVQYVYAARWTFVHADDGEQVWDWSFTTSEAEHHETVRSITVVMNDFQFSDDEQRELMQTYAWRLPKTVDALKKMLEEVAA